MRKIKAILNNKRGTSIVLVLCLTLLFFAIGISVLVAAAGAAGANTARQQNTIRYYYAKSLAEYLTESVTEPLAAPPSTASPWVQIPQQVYELAMQGETAKVDAFQVAISDISQDSWVEDPASTGYEATIDSQNVVVKQEYVPELEGIGAPGDDDYLPAVPAVPEETMVEIQMTVKITVRYNDGDYLLNAHYRFAGTTKGDISAPGTGEIDSGEWVLLGYSQE